MTEEAATGRISRPIELGEEAKGGQFQIPIKEFM